MSTPVSQTVTTELSIGVTKETAPDGTQLIQLGFSDLAIGIGVRFNAEVLRDALGALFQKLSETCDEVIAHNKRQGGIVVASADTLHTLKGKEHPHGNR